MWPAAIPPQVGTPLVDYAAGSPLALNLTPPGDAAAAPPALLQSDTAVRNGLPHASIDFSSQPRDLGAWKLEATSVAVGQIAASLWNPVAVGGATQNRLKPEVIEDVVLVAHYSVT